MATTIATASAAVQERLLLSGTAPDSTVLQSSDYVRRGFKELWGVLPPIQHGSVALVGSGRTLTAPLTASRVYYVQNGATLLLPGEWGFAADVLHVERAAAAAADSVSAYYDTAPTIALDPDDAGTGTAAVDSTCIFGPDWLEEGAILLACMQAYRRLHRVGGTNNPTGYLEALALVKEEYQEWLKAHMKVWESWRGEMDDRAKLRLSLNDQPFLESPFAGFENESRITPTYGKFSTRLPDYP